MVRRHRIAKVEHHKGQGTMSVPDSVYRSRSVIGGSVLASVIRSWTTPRSFVSSCTCLSVRRPGRTLHCVSSVQCEAGVTLHYAATRQGVAGSIRRQVAEPSDSEPVSRNPSPASSDNDLLCAFAGPSVGCQHQAFEDKGVRQKNSACRNEHQEQTNLRAAIYGREVA
eukprot:2360145-Rhodomonas_salina.3